MLNVTLDAIFNHLKQQNRNPQMQQETKQIYLILHLEGKEYPLFIRLYDEGNMLQMIAFIPCPLTQAVVGDVARLLHLLNKELDIPGFGMDESAGVVFYRIMLPTPHKKVEGSYLDAFIQTFERVLSIFTKPIQAVGVGAATFEQLLAKAKEGIQK